MAADNIDNSSMDEVGCCIIQQICAVLVDETYRYKGKVVNKLRNIRTFGISSMLGYET
jgi:hypothetical protein